MSNFFMEISGVALNHHGHAEKENMPFHHSIGKACSQKMGGSVMVGSSSWKEFAVEWVYYSV